MKNARLRQGFTIVELVVSIFLISYIMVSFFQFIATAKEDRNVFDELVLYDVAEDGLKRNFVSIIDTFEPICSNITTDTTNNWGWSHAKCSATSPYPVFSNGAGGERLLTYSINFSSLSANLQSVLASTIITNLRGVCTKKGVSNTSVVLTCPKVVDFLYDIGGGFTRTVHALGTDINPTIPPIVKLRYDRRSEIGNVASVNDYEFNMNEVYSFRQNISRSKFHRIKTAMKQFNEAKLVSEFRNPPPTSLHSMDDNFVPWFWEIFGDNGALIPTQLCTVVGGICTNLQSDSFWRTTKLASKGMYLRRIGSNILSGDTSISVDGFNNQVFIYPISSQCLLNDISACATTAPTIPQDDYIGLGAGTPKPPFSSIIYLDSSKLKNTPAPSYMRLYFTY